MAGLESILRTIATGSPQTELEQEYVRRAQGIDTANAAAMDAARNTELSNLRQDSTNFAGGVNQAVANMDSGNLIQDIMAANLGQDPQRAAALQQQLDAQQQVQQAAAEYAPHGVKDAWDNGRMGDFLANLGGQTAVNLLPQVGVSYLTRGLGRRASMAAGAAAGYDMNRGEAASNLYNDPVAWAEAQRNPLEAMQTLNKTAGFSTATDIAPGMIGGRIAKGSGDALVRGAKPNLLNVPAGMLAEGAQETIQQGISDIGRASLTDRATKDIIDPDAYLDSFVGGALMGGGVAGAGALGNAGLAEVGELAGSLRESGQNRVQQARERAAAAKQTALDTARGTVKETIQKAATDTKQYANERFNAAKNYTAEQVQAAADKYDEVQTAAMASGKVGNLVNLSTRAAQAAVNAGDFLRRHYDNGMATADRIWNDVQIDPETGNIANDAGMTAGLMGAARNITRLSRDQAAAYTQRLLGEDYGYQNTLDTLHRYSNAREWSEMAAPEREAKKSAVLQAGTEFITNLPVGQGGAISKKARREILSNPKLLQKAAVLHDRAKMVHTWARENGDVEAGAFAEAYLTGKVKVSSAAVTQKLNAITGRIAQTIAKEKIDDLYTGAVEVASAVTHTADDAIVSAILKSGIKGNAKANKQAVPGAQEEATFGKQVSRVLRSFIKPELQQDPERFTAVQQAVHNNMGAIADKILKGAVNQAVPGKMTPDPLTAIFDSKSFPEMKQLLTGLVEKNTKVDPRRERGKMSSTISPKQNVRADIASETPGEPSDASQLSERREKPPAQVPASLNRNIAYSIQPRGLKDKFVSGALQRKGVTIQSGKDFFKNLEEQGEPAKVFLARMKKIMEEMLLGRAHEDSGLATAALNRMKNDGFRSTDAQLAAFRTYAKENGIPSAMDFLKTSVDKAVGIKEPQKLWTDTTTKAITENAGNYLPSELAEEMLAAYTVAAAQRSFGGSVTRGSTDRIGALRHAVSKLDARTQGRIALALTDELTTVIDKQEQAKKESRDITAESVKALTARYSSVMKAMRDLDLGKKDWADYFDVSVGEVDSEEKGYVATDDDLKQYQNRNDKPGTGTTLTIHFKSDTGGKSHSPMRINTRSMISATRINKNNNAMDVDPSPQIRFTEALAKVMARDDVAKITLTPYYGDRYYGEKATYGTQESKAAAKESMKKLPQAGKPIVIADTDKDGKLTFSKSVGSLPENSWLMPPNKKAPAILLKEVLANAPKKAKPLTDAQKETRRTELAQREKDKAIAADTRDADTDEAKKLVAADLKNVRKSADEAEMDVMASTLRTYTARRSWLKKDTEKKLGEERNTASPDAVKKNSDEEYWLKAKSSVLNKLITAKLRKDYPVPDFKQLTRDDNDEEFNNEAEDLWEKQLTKFVLEERLDVLDDLRLSFSGAAMALKEELYGNKESGKVGLVGKIEEMQNGGVALDRERHVAIFGENPQVVGGSHAADVEFGKRRMEQISNAMNREADYLFGTGKDTKVFNKKQAFGSLSKRLSSLMPGYKGVPINDKSSALQLRQAKKALSEMVPNEDTARLLEEYKGYLKLLYDKRIREVVHGEKDRALDKRLSEIKAQPFMEEKASVVAETRARETKLRNQDANIYTGGLVWSHGEQRFTPEPTKKKAKGKEPPPIELTTPAQRAQKQLDEKAAAERVMQGNRPRGASPEAISKWMEDKEQADLARVNYARQRAEASFLVDLAEIETELRDLQNKIAITDKTSALYKERAARLTLLREQKEKVTTAMTAAGAKAAQKALQAADKNAIQTNANNALAQTLSEVVTLSEGRATFRQAQREFAQKNGNTPTVRGIQKKYNALAQDLQAKFDKQAADVKGNSERAKKARKKIEDQSDAAFIDLTRQMNQELSALPQKGVGKSTSGKKSNAQASLQQPRKKERSETAQDKLRNRLVAELKRTSGSKVSLIFNRTAAAMGMTGSFERRMKEDDKGAEQWTGEYDIEMAINAADPDGVLSHETFHHFWDVMGISKAIRKAKLKMQKVVQSAAVRHKVFELLVAEDVKNGETRERAEAKFAVELADPEEALAYAYQMYLKHPDEMKEVLNTQAIPVLSAIKQFAMDFFGLITQSEKTQRIFDALNNGDFANEDVRRDVFLNGYGKTLSEAFDGLGQIATLYESVVDTALERVRATNVPALKELADLVSLEVGEAVGRSDFMSEREQLAGKLKNRAERIINSFEDDAAQILAVNNLQSRYDAKDGQEKQVRVLLDSVKGMLQNAGVDMKFVKNNYFPRVWDTGIIEQRRSEFIELLKSEGGMKHEDAVSITSSMLAHGGLSDVASNPNDIGYVPLYTSKQGVGDNYFQSANGRAFDFMDEKNAHKFAEFQQKDLGYVLDTYLTEAAHKIVHAKMFGAKGEKVDALLEQARKEGATGDELDFAVDAMNGVMGTLKQNKLSQGTKSVLGWGMFAMNAAMLPLALVSQMVDPFAIAARSGELGDAMDAFRSGFKQLFSGISGEKEKEYHHQLADFLGILNGDLSTQALGSMANSRGAQLRKWSNKYFKAIGMQAFNDGMRIAATAAADRYIVRKAEEGDTEALAELGITASDVKTDAEGRLVVQGVPAVEKAVFRYVQSSVVTSNNANQPQWMNDPVFVLLAHMRRFAYAFDKVVLQRATKQFREYGNSTPLMMLLASMPMIMAADMAKWAVTGGPATADWGIGGYLAHASSRAGLYGRFGAFGSPIPGGAPLDFRMDLGPTYGVLEALSSMNLDKLLDKLVLGHKFL